MQRLRTAIMIALAWCLFSASNLAIAQHPPSSFSLELRFATPPIRNAPHVVLTVRIGTFASRTSSCEAWPLPNLTAYFASWRDRAIDLLIKQLHMA